MPSCIPKFATNLTPKRNRNCHVPIPGKFKMLISLHALPFNLISPDAPSRSNVGG